MTASGWGRRIREAIAAACHPVPGVDPSVGEMAALVVLVPRFRSDAVPLDLGVAASGTGREAAIDVDRLVVRLFEQEGQSLVRLARIFVDDRNAAEDLVQEAFIRLARSAHRIRDEAKAAPYLRSIVLNLARDNNQRGLAALEERLGDASLGVVDEVTA